MLKVYRNPTTEIEEHGVGISMQLSYTVPEENVFQNEENLKLVKELYSKTQTHNTITSITNSIDSVFKEFNAEVVSDILSDIVNLDHQTYYDIMYIIKSILNCLDNNEMTKFINSVKHVVSEEPCACKECTCESEQYNAIEDGDKDSSTPEAGKDIPEDDISID